MSVTTKQISLGVGDRNISLTQMEGARGPIVFVVSGWQSSGLGPIAQALARKGGRVIMFDGPVERKWFRSGEVTHRLSTDAGALQFFAEALVGRGPQVKTHVIGQSVGAAVATTLAAALQSDPRSTLRLASLTLISPFSSLRNGAMGRAERLRAFPRLVANLPLSMSRGWEQFVKDGEYECHWDVCEFLRGYTAFPFRILARLSELGQATLETLPNIGVQTEIFQANHDLLSAPIPAEVVAQCPNAKFHDYDGGHFALLDFNRYQLVRHLRTITA